MPTRRRGSPLLARATWSPALACSLAQGMPPLEAAAAWIHSEAWQCVEPGMISEDLGPRSDEVYRRLFSGGLVQRIRAVREGDQPLQLLYLDGDTPVTCPP